MFRGVVVVAGFPVVEVGGCACQSPHRQSYPPGGGPLPGPPPMTTKRVTTTAIIVRHTVTPVATTTPATIDALHRARWGASSSMAWVAVVC